MPNTRIPGACPTPSFLAAGLILGGIGTDTGGSIRGPAALCGIAGIKPTYGLVSRAGVAPAAHSLDHIGPMAGHDSRDPASASRPLPDYTALLGRGIKGLKIGVILLRRLDRPIACLSQSLILAFVVMASPVPRAFCPRTSTVGIHGPRARNEEVDART
jgi:Asp-tRNA(Asn)/Glu-tRNA(Gln) amidotransferase A subunit family amidase